MKVESYVETYGNAVFTVSPSNTVAEVSRKFAETVNDKRYSIAVVCEEGDKVVGIVSLGDIVWTVGRLEEKAPSIEVHHIMSRDIQSCSMDEMLDSVLKRMADHGIRHMPVIENGKLAGLVARREALEFLYKWAKLDVENLTEWVFSSEARY
jgi:CBS domain-containing protein